MTTIERSGVDHSWWRNYHGDTRSAPVAPKVPDVPVTLSMWLGSSIRSLSRLANFTPLQSA